MPPAQVIRKYRLAVLVLGVALAAVTAMTVYLAVSRPIATASHDGPSTSTPADANTQQSASSSAPTPKAPASDQVQAAIGDQRTGQVAGLGPVDLRPSSAPEGIPGRSGSMDLRLAARPAPSTRTSSSHR